VQYRAAPGGDGIDRQHGRSQANAGDLGLEDPLVFAGVVRHVGRGAAHVEADHPIETGQRRHLSHADDPTGRPGQDRVLAAEVSRLGEAAGGLHEHQPDVTELVGDPLDVAPQDRREVRVDHSGVPAGHQPHQRADLAGE
jgi:hypothetical protein